MPMVAQSMQHGTLDSPQLGFAARTASFYQQLADFYKLGAPTSLIMNKDFDADELSKVKISFNGVKLTKGKFNGKFFAGRKITLEGAPVDGKEVTGWEITQVSTGGSITKNEISGNQYVFDMPVCQSLYINAVLGNADGIDNVDATNYSWHTENGCLTVSNIPAHTKISLYNMDGTLSYRSTGEGTISIPLKQNFYVLKIGDKAVKITNRK
jgi:hypothetical protein